MSYPDISCLIKDNLYQGILYIGMFTNSYLFNTARILCQLLSLLTRTDKDWRITWPSTLNWARIYSLSANSLTYRQDYATGTLDCTQTTDEDGHISLEFKERATGRVLLLRAMDGEMMLDTYYVYDNYENLGLVLSPAASDLLASTTTPAS